MENSEPAEAVAVSDGLQLSTPDGSHADTRAKPTPQTITTGRGTKVGVYAETVTALYNFEHETGLRTDFVATSVHWGNDATFPKEISALIAPRDTTTLVIFWNPMDYERTSTEQDEFHFSEITDGAWDEYIESFKADARAYGKPVIIAPFEEVNGSWTFWNPTRGLYGTTEEYKEAYQYLRNQFRDASNVSFAWVVNHVSVPDSADNSISSYYPGDAYVDIIGINVFNFGDPWLSFDVLVENAIKTLSPYGKPLYITSTACREGAEKAGWIQDLFRSPHFSRGTLSGFIWFNENKERDWRITSDSTATESFVRNFTALHR